MKKFVIIIMENNQWYGTMDGKHLTLQETYNLIAKGTPYRFEFSSSEVKQKVSKGGKAMRQYKNLACLTCKYVIPKDNEPYCTPRQSFT